jgi:hypothetical protein
MRLSINSDVSGGWSRRGWLIRYKVVGDEQRMTAGVIYISQAVTECT